MNAEPLIPLPKQRPNTGLEPVQLLMLFLLWALGMTLAILAFLAELMLGVKAKQHKPKVTTQNNERSTKCRIKEPKCKNVLTVVEVE